MNREKRISEDDLLSVVVVLFVFYGSDGSSYIDTVVLRQKDDNSGWTSAADGVLEQRYYYCQNWRADVSAIVNASGKMMEWVKYSSYGIPFGLPAGDTDSDGDCDQTDINNIDAAISYDVRYDLDLDGDVDAADSSRASSTFQGTTLGRGVLSSSSVGNRKGYSGYEYDEAVGKYHVRNRILDPALGRWTRRDPLGYVDGMSLYEYVGSRVKSANDPRGLREVSQISAGKGKKCCDWWRKNGNLGWMAKLPSCPCKANKKPPDWSTDPDQIRETFHPGAAACYRSRAIANGARQQCCYDASGSLITGGRAAGTPDKNKPTNHFIDDVIPFIWCDSAGLVGCYLEARPPNFIPCKANPVNMQGLKPCDCTLVEV